MKPAPFEYIRPGTLDEACALIAADEDARLIAGGQTLVPMLAMRLARPARIIDIARLPELSGIRDDGKAIVIGAATRQRQAEQNALVAGKLPLLALALPWVGHPPTRTRGTVGGSIANADPSAEIPLVAVTLGAEMTTREGEDETRIAADDFFIGAMVTAVPPTGCVTEVRFPIWSEGRIGVGFHEISARRSDFAFVSAAAQVALDEDGKCLACVLGVGGVGDRPVRFEQACSALVGTGLSDAEIQEAVRDEAAALDATSDLHASADYRRRAAAALAERALADARDQAKGLSRSGAPKPGARA
jgi:CO/xanthine dehydrogenase FAD-binding subunit